MIIIIFQDNATAHPGHGQRPAKSYNTVNWHHYLYGRRVEFCPVGMGIVIYIYMYDPVINLHTHTHTHTLFLHFFLPWNLKHPICE